MRSWMPLILLIGLRCPSLAQDDPRQSPYFAVPELRQVMEWATFQLTFDAGSMMPDMAAGDAKLGVNGTPQFVPGLRGQALVAGEGSGAAGYASVGNVSFASQGAIALWVMPVAWTHVQGGNTVFLMTSNSNFYLERQGPWIEGTELKRQEAVLYLLFSKTVGNGCLSLGTNDWPLNQWRLIVANWSWPTMSLSLDGGEFQSATLKGKPPAEEFGGLYVGASGGEKTLLDEITIFRRPLTLAEVKAMYEALRVK